MMPSSFDQLDALGERHGYRQVDPPVLQPADLFLDLLGEDMRRRAFLTQDADGREYCLRPDFTIPVSRLHLADASGAIGTYSYRGPVFRLGAASGEIAQAGFESFGRADTEAADAELLGLAVEACVSLGVAHPGIQLGDAGLASAFLDTLDLPAAWRRRLAADVLRSRNLDADIARLAEARHTGASRAGFLAALEGTDPAAARATVADLLSIAGIRPVGGRSIDEIADRFLEQASLAVGGVPRETAQLIQTFFAIGGDPDSASTRMRALAHEAQLDLSRELDAFDLRTGFITAYGVDPAGIRFATAFTRNLDYYTGVVFTLTREDGEELVGGGRYDRLMSELGAPQPVPAVGCSIWLDRFGAEPAA